MNSQLYLFTGENSFALTEEVQRWRKNFLERHGEANLQLLTGKDVQLNELLDEVQAAPFLAEKRLIVIDGIPPKMSKEELESLTSAMDPHVILAFVDPSPDKRKSVTKWLIKNAELKTFTMQTPKQLVSWLQELAHEHRIELRSDVAAHLVAIVGSDQWHLKNELLKLIAHSEQPSVTTVDSICLPSQKHTIWKISDLIGQGKTSEAVTFCKTLIDQGEDPFALWNIVLWVIKNMSILWLHVQNTSSTNMASISKESGVPFPSARALLPLVKKLNEDQMQLILDSAVEADLALKTGKVKATSTEPIEVTTLLDRTITRIRE